MSLTAKELEVLKAIDTSEYGDYLDDAIWSWALSDNVENVEPASLPGVVASLSKKGLIAVDSVERHGDEATISMTDEGIAAYVEAVGAENVGKVIRE